MKYLINKFLVKKNIDFTIFSFALIFSIFVSYNKLLADDAVSSVSNSTAISTIQAVDEIEKALIFFDKNGEKKTRKTSNLSINRSDYLSNSKIEILVKRTNQNNASDQQQKLAYSAMSAGQYEAAVEIYKKIIKLHPDDNYSKFALASCYHFLSQYKQAKNLYYELLKYQWSDDETKGQLISNFISLIVEESPLESVYFLSKLSNENPSSAYIIAGAAMAYNKINKPDQAILFLKRALSIDPENSQYKFNLAVIYDQTQDYKNALINYQDVLSKYISGNNNEKSVPMVEVSQRIEFLKDKIK